LVSAEWIECTLRPMTSSSSSTGSLYFYGLFVPSVVFSIVYIGGIPLLFWGLLYANRVNLRKLATKEVFGFLYENFKDEMWWMEILLLFRRVIIVSVMSIIPSTYAVGVIVVVLTLTMFLLFILLIKPFRRSIEVNAEIISTLSLLMLVIFGSYYQSFQMYWINLLGLLVYLITLLYLFLVLIYPQVRRYGLGTLCCVRPFQYFSSLHSQYDPAPKIN
jgi:hypothetical protein